ncbi:hypothetical protein EC912_101761 [Luteibacter rhizovicinus]|uniref:Uncharacterized protein n=1 Tax=Luteibacter rhizovicinus TaxID=242606 RepID=A0A4R3Z1L4_9GAMM|nr:hypothetical protein EC912_101761 [Luteibacter rhizovicinus]
MDTMRLIAVVVLGVAVAFNLFRALLRMTRRAEMSPVWAVGLLLCCVSICLSIYGVFRYFAQSGV